MPKRDIEYVQGGYYHVYNRGAGGHHLFIETENYLYVIRQMKKYSYLLQVTIIAYCLMPNHYHHPSMLSILAGKGGFSRLLLYLLE